MDNVICMLVNRRLNVKYSSCLDGVHNFCLHVRRNNLEDCGFLRLMFLENQAVAFKFIIIIIRYDIFFFILFYLFIYFTCMMFVPLSACYCIHWFLSYLWNRCSFLILLSHFFN